MSDYINNYEYIQENPNVLNSNVNGLNSNPINPNISLAEAGASSNEVVSSLGLMNNQSQEQDNMLLLEEDKYTDICIGDSFQTMELLVDRIYSLYMDEDKHILKKIRQRNSAGNVSNLLFYCKLSKCLFPS